MKNKITTLTLVFSVIAANIPAVVFAEDYPVSSYNYNAPISSGYDYSAPFVSGYNYTAPVVSEYDYSVPFVSSYNYNTPAVSSYNFTAPTVSGYDYTSPSVSSYNYTSPTLSGYDYTSPVTSSYNYTAPTVSGYDYTSPSVSSYNYTSPTVSEYNYTSPTVSGYDYTSPVTSSYNYTSPVISSYDYTSPVNSGYNYTSPNYTSPNYTSPNYTSPNYTSPNYTSPNYTSPNYTTGGSYVGGTYTGSTYVGGVTYPGNNQVVTQINCPTGSVLTNGQCINTITGTVITTTVCPQGTTLNGTNCINSVNGTIVTHVVCPTGSTLTNGQCVNTINGTIVTNVVCTSGTLVNGQCVNTITPPVTTVTNCPSNTRFVNGTCQQVINPPVVTYQTCWDGAVIPATSMCAPQYKVCANGTSVPINQACYVPPTPVYVPPQIVKFNNVVTSIATQITNTSGRCNGIGLIANGAPSTGWFEYGETANLGRTTASAQIGSANTAPFSNVLANLKPSTKYYCRAVMQNQYGLVKGEIVSFVTKAKAVTYVKPIVIPTKKPTKTPVKTNEIICSDGSTVSVKNETSATLINKGEKLVAVQIEKTDGTLSAGSVVHYKVSYKNLTDTRLLGVLVKVTLPQEIMFTSASVGNYDATTRTLVLNQESIDPYTEGVILVTGTVLPDAPLGKTVVSNVYTLYTVPSTKTQDEVTAYVVGSIVPSVDTINKDTGVKKVVGAQASGAQGFMPNSLIEWLALLAILFIIFILGRSIYASYKDDEGAKAH